MKVANKPHLTDVVTIFKAFQNGTLTAAIYRYTNQAIEEPDFSIKLDPTWPGSIPDDYRCPFTIEHTFHFVPFIL